MKTWKWEIQDEGFTSWYVDNECDDINSFNEKVDLAIIEFAAYNDNCDDVKFRFYYEVDNKVKHFKEVKFFD